MDKEKLALIARLIRYYSILCTSKAQSGHLTSSLSATDLMAVLYFNFFRFNFEDPHNKYNDRLIFSKGHASPLLYSLYKVAGLITEDELLTYRTFYSPLQGHPTPETPYVDVATGSLGMGLSMGLGMALAAQSNKITNKVYVLLGDSEIAEGQIWEALETASYYKVNNLIGILDVNRLGQAGKTMLEHDMTTYEKRISAFGWNTVVIDGHDFDEITNAFSQPPGDPTKPTMIIAKTIKGKGVSFAEDKEGWHAKFLNQEDEQKAIAELALTEQEKAMTFPVNKPDKDETIKKSKISYELQSIVESIAKESNIATKKGYGMALAEIAKQDSSIMALDAEVANSTHTDLVQKSTPGEFLNLFIAEQNMISVAAGLSKMGKNAVATTFAAFLTRAYDQIRMASLSNADLVIGGSYCGVSIGKDGASQMGLEDIAMIRPILTSTIVYPSDGVAAARLLADAITREGINYIRTTREPTPVIYSTSETFPLGKSKVLRSSDQDYCTVVAAGITLHEALKAYEELKSENIFIKVIDCYSVKPIDDDALKQAANQTNNHLIVVEDHYFEGGLGDAVLNVFADNPATHIYKLAVRQKPHSGEPLELLDAYNISARAIKEKVKSLLNTV